MRRLAFFIACFVSSLAAAAPAAPRVQGMWWGGPSESGWGLIVVQHEERIFLALAVYDTIAHTTWFVVPSASWNEDHTAFSGSAYWPRASDFPAYDAGSFQPGAPVGEISVKLDPSGEATMSYKLDVYSGTKSIKPLVFGPDAPSHLGDLTDIWLGGPSQNGWGVAILQQGETLVAVWLTYFGPNHTEPAWFMLQGGAWADANTYSGRIIRPFGPQWLGTTFNPQLFQAPDNGPFSITFTDKDHAVLGYSVVRITGELQLVRMPF